MVQSGSRAVGQSGSRAVGQSGAIPCARASAKSLPSAHPVHVDVAGRAGHGRGAAAGRWPPGRENEPSPGHVVRRGDRPDEAPVPEHLVLGGSTIYAVHVPGVAPVTGWVRDGNVRAVAVVVDLELAERLGKVNLTGHLTRPTRIHAERPYGRPVIDHVARGRAGAGEPNARLHIIAHVQRPAVRPCPVAGCGGKIASRTVSRQR